jgi:type I restriction enzyme S subunit
MTLERTGTTFFGISQESIGAFLFVVPPIGEQRVILNFLDRKTAKIDGLVGEQRRLIELLKEKRQAIIPHAVTKGLNPDVPMKCSGIEWLGDLPQHWHITRLARICSEINDIKHEMPWKMAFPFCQQKTCSITAR